jgi:hypothetical protein
VFNLVLRVMGLPDQGFCLPRLLDWLGHKASPFLVEQLQSLLLVPQIDDSSVHHPLPMIGGTVQTTITPFMH